MQIPIRDSCAMRKLSEIPQVTRLNLAAGTVETADWTEWMATDMSALARKVASRTSSRRLATSLSKAAEEIHGMGILDRLAVLGRAVSVGVKNFDSPPFLGLCLHRSDVVRQWAAYAVNSPHRRLPLEVRLALTRRFAADHHMSVRECAWMAFRPHLSSQLAQGLKLIEHLSLSCDANERRFAVEVSVALGGSLGRNTPMSAILFGPPGTSKTKLAEIISAYLGWPLVMIDPSYLVSSGMDRIQAMANKLFTMLSIAEQIVVLLDEFDEMGRDRSRTENLLSRFITTAMLPKLAEINKERKIVFLLANYVSGFDAAFSRGGRFDMLLQIMPPNLKAKRKQWPELFEALKRLSDEERPRAERLIADLTFDETAALKSKLTSVSKTVVAITGLLNNAWLSCTLNKPNDIGDRFSEDKRHPPLAPTWRVTSETERRQIRIPGK